MARVYAYTKEETKTLQELRRVLKKVQDVGLLNTGEWQFQITNNVRALTKMEMDTIKAIGRKKIQKKALATAVGCRSTWDLPIDKFDKLKRVGVIESEWSHKHNLRYSLTKRGRAILKELS